MKTMTATTRRTTSSHAAFNNPVIIIDVNGKKSLPADPSTLSIDSSADVLEFICTLYNSLTSAAAAAAGTADAAAGAGTADAAAAAAAATAC